MSDIRASILTETTQVRPGAFVSWSGGKDGCLALHKARADGLDVRVLLSMLEEDGSRNRSHAIPRPWLKRQAEALGCQLVTPAASWQTYEAKFVGAVQELQARGIETAIFGDIDLEAHREWEAKILATLGVQPLWPLWHIDRRAAVEEFWAAGYEALVVCVAARWLDASFCGRPFDRDFVRDLPSDVDWCGENGEFHTFVTNGPSFAHPLQPTVEAIYESVLPPDMGGARFFYAQLDE